MKKVGVKYCPRCGTANSFTDSYCIKCGYAFVQKKRKNNIKKILILITILLLGWITYRTFTSQPIIPSGILNLFQNTSLNSALNLTK